MFLMLYHTYFASYADGNTPYTVNENNGDFIWTLEQISKPLLQWFKDNKVKLSHDQFHLILICKENTKLILETLSLKLRVMKSS